MKTQVVQNPNPKTRRPWIVVAILAVALLAAACGGSDEASSSSVASVADVQTEEPTAPSAVVEADEPNSADEAQSDTDETSTEDDDDSEGEAAEPVADADLTDEEQALEFVACMRENGVDLDDPTVAADGSIQLFNPGAGGAGLPNRDEGFEGAIAVCGDTLEGATFFQRDDDTTERDDQLLGFAQCLRDQGFDIDDPDLSAGPGAIRGIFGDDFDPQDPANAEVLNLCRDESGFTGGGR